MAMTSLPGLATFRSTQAAAVGLDTRDVAQPPAASLDAPPTEKDTETHEQHGKGEYEKGNEDCHERLPSV